jgi:uncharacterized protein
MAPSINIVSVAVNDLDRALAFYRDGLGWPCWSHPAGSSQVQSDTDGSPDHAAFELQGGLSFVLYSRAALTRDAQEPPLPKGSTDFILTHYVATERDVESFLDQAMAAGATLVGGIDRQPWGTSGMFRDLDGHLWQVMWPNEAVGDTNTN